MSHAGFHISRRLVGFALVLMITACTSQRHRPDSSTVERLPEITAPTQADHIEQQQIPEPPAYIAPLSPWDRLRTRFAMDGCTYSEAVTREAHRYTRSPERFSASWQEAMPSLLLVLKDIERRDLPGEFALLPYVESHYRILPAKVNGPAGVWQLTSRTAIDQGLKVNRDYDQRLDLLASTDVALRLIERYDREFSDWRLADMAFNAGEYRVKRALGDTSTTSLDPQHLTKLKLTATTHQHLIRLLALSCIVAEPEKFGVELPEENSNDLLVEVIPPAAIDLRLAASLAGLSMAEVLRSNAAWSGQTHPHGPAQRLLLPARSIERLNLALKDFPANMLGAWQARRIEVPTTLVDLASALGISPHVLAAANHLAENKQLNSGQSLLLPGSELTSRPPNNRDVHPIKPGDTLSAIARHYRIRLEDLLRWNGLSMNSTLRLGSTLHIHAPSY